MKKLEVKGCEQMRTAIRQEIVRSEETRYDHKLHGVLLACSGMSCGEIAGVLGRSTRTIHYWIGRFNSEGFSGLREKEGRGRPNRLTQKDIADISSNLHSAPGDHGYSQSVWNGKLLSLHIREKYGKTLSARQCQRLFCKLGFKPRETNQ